jgi:murein DD-endopeptidase MepM/ murein hydrolase activator NlpD
MKSVTVAAAGIFICSSAVVHAARPWPLREPPVEPVPAHQLRTPSTWPAEPAAPEMVDDVRFRAAFARLCKVDEDGAIAALSHDVLTAARENGVDPFLIGGLAFYASHCNPKLTGKGGAYGLLAINPEMYRVEGAPPPPVPRTDLTVRRLLDPVNNIAVGAKLLKEWRETHAAIDAAFGGAAHRSEVSHFIWGDEVRGSGQEDLVLTARRRLLLDYNPVAEAPRPTKLGINVVSPLEAPPRVATSGPGDDRDGGARQHRGLDITATMGEPVRTIADGVVIFAGANVPGHPRKGPIPPEKIARYAHRRLGVGGIYVCIEHEAERKIRTCYMHLASYVIHDGDHVNAGQLIGYVGRTGVKISPPHLHLEVRVQDHFANPARTLGDLVIPPKATMTHVYMLKAKRARRLRA